MKKDSIYLITTLDWCPNKSHKGSRCLGYFTDLEEASNHIRANSYDMHEVNNNYVVVEKVTGGLYPSVIEEIWFEWLDEFGGYVQLNKKPEVFKTICNFGIG